MTGRKSGDSQDSGIKTPSASCSQQNQTKEESVSVVMSVDSSFWIRAWVLWPLLEDFVSIMIRGYVMSCHIISLVCV